MENAARSKFPGGAKIIDVTGKTLLPGFVDTHYHAQGLIWEIHPAQHWEYLTTLAYGVTTTRDPQTQTTDVLSYQDRVESGGMLGPRVYSTGPGVGIPDGENIRDLDHARTVLKRYSQYWDTKTLKMYMSGNRQQRQWIIMAAKELGIMPTTEGGLDFKLELTHAMDGYPGVEHALPIAPLYNDVVELFKASQTTNTPTLLVSYGGPFGENYYYATENVHGDAKLRHFLPRAGPRHPHPAARYRLGRQPRPGRLVPERGVRLSEARRVCQADDRERGPDRHRQPRPAPGPGLSDWILSRSELQMGCSGDATWVGLGNFETFLWGESGLQPLFWAALGHNVEFAAILTVGGDSDIAAASRPLNRNDDRGSIAPC